MRQHFFRDYVVIQANKLGITPKEFAARFPYTIVAQDQIQISPEQQLFNQDGSVRLETPQFKTFFGKSVIKKMVNQKFCTMAHEIV